MKYLFSPKNFIFWWAALTATLFVQDAIRWLSQFFRNSAVFAQTVPPFSLVSGLNDLIDQMANAFLKNVSFDPNGVLVKLGPITIGNWIFAVLAAILILAGAAVIYVRALKTSAILDDLGALFLLYFVLQIEAYLFSLSKLPILSQQVQGLLNNQAFLFGVLVLLLAVLTLTGGGYKDVRSFWRGGAELLIVALLIFPTQTAQLLATSMDYILLFDSMFTKYWLFAILWGGFGFLLAMNRLIHVDANVKA